jgi:hypothetical protein
MRTPLGCAGQGSEMGPGSAAGLPLPAQPKPSADSSSASCSRVPLGALPESRWAAVGSLPLPTGFAPSRRPVRLYTAHSGGGDHAGLQINLGAPAPGEPEANTVLHFQPNPPEPMIVACLWSHWTGNGERDLDSFARLLMSPRFCGRTDLSNHRSFLRSTCSIESSRGRLLRLAAIIGCGE